MSVLTMMITTIGMYYVNIIITCSRQESDQDNHNLNEH